MTWFYYLAAAGFGLIFGSFFNVVIYRVPNDESLGARSRCPLCGEMIHWYDNIPLLSFVLLKGRCRRCGAGISWRYPLVELSTAALFVITYWWSIAIVPGELGVTTGRIAPELFIGMLMVSVLIISTGVDLTHGIIPNRVMYPSLVLMLALVTGIALYRGQPGRIGLAVAGGAIGGGFLFIAGLLYGAVFMRGHHWHPDGQEENDGRGEAGPDTDDEDPAAVIPTGIGMGDVKLLAFTGMALGYFHWYLVLVGLFLGFLTGALVSIFLVIFAGHGRKDRLPFAPFLSAGCIAALLWGKQLVDVYLGLFR